MKGASVTIDANGFRTSKSIEGADLRVLFVGDSVTWGGSSVDDSDLFTEVASDVIRSDGRTVYSMNAGVNGSSLMNQGDIYLARQDAVDVLVWLFPWTDTLRSYASAGFLWPATKKPRFALVEAGDHVIRSLWLTSFREEGQSLDGEFVYPEVPGGYESFFEGVLENRTARNIDALRRTVEVALGKETPVIVGITPERVGNELIPNEDRATEQMEQLAAQGANILNVHQVLTSADQDIASLYIDSIHFNREGHRVLGESLGKFLRQVLQDHPKSAADSAMGMVDPLPKRHSVQ